ncbi:DMT family transporter [Agarivorans sp. MS3-6]|uniref:DMT family transporter n=1 Tax=Agarivorans sp. TSD2052 TaxID=2937286 RepID=UPI00200D76B5|nr:DMT family transporter [Agarivorans sp. TSD2052]UPW18797.1 DMT family transporter [Agarivorans sp. TSD2052]
MNISNSHQRVSAVIARIPPTTIGLALALLATALFSLKGIWIKLAYLDGIDPASLMTLRMAFSLPIYLALGLFWWLRGRFTNKPIASHLLTASLVGIAGYYLASYLDLSGLQYISAPLERVVLYVYPSFTILLAWLVYQHKPQAVFIVALPISWLGVALMMWSETSNQGLSQGVLLGTGLVVASAFSFAFYLVFSKAIVNQIGSQAFTCIAMIAASLAIFIHFFLQDSLNPLDSYPEQVYVYALYMAIFSTVIPSFLFSEAINRIGAQRTAISGSAGPVFTLLMANWVLGDSISLYQLVGIALVIMAVAMLNRK